MKPVLTFLVLVLSIFAGAAMARDLEPRDGWEVFPTEKTYDQLLTDVKAAVEASDMGVVTEAGPTEAAAGRGVTIPGNRVIGVFNNEVAVRVLELSTAAMIEAPIRLYVTENTDGTATLAYKTPSIVFTAYFEEGGSDLVNLASELDHAFAAIAVQAVK